MQDLHWLAAVARLQQMIASLKVSRLRLLYCAVGRSASNKIEAAPLRRKNNTMKM
jgi:hypothetical protein